MSNVQFPELLKYLNKFMNEFQITCKMRVDIWSNSCVIMAIRKITLQQKENSSIRFFPPMVHKEKNRSSKRENLSHYLDYLWRSHRMRKAIKDPQHRQRTKLAAIGTEPPSVSVLKRHVLAMWNRGVIKQSWRSETGMPTRKRLGIEGTDSLIVNPQCSSSA